jgi:hypothetical protein
VKHVDLDDNTSQSWCVLAAELQDGRLVSLAVDSPQGLYDTILKVIMSDHAGPQTTNV